MRALPGQTLAGQVPQLPLMSVASGLGNLTRALLSRDLLSENRETKKLTAFRDGKEYKMRSCRKRAGRHSGGFTCSHCHTTVENPIKVDR